ncbi:7456_t:CDS:1, partial [Acaulospora colombiana]
MYQTESTFAIAPILNEDLKDVQLHENKHGSKVYEISNLSEKESTTG